MSKIKIVTDSASDIPKKYEKEADILILPFHITVGDKSYTERADFTNKEFYRILRTYEEIPTTSQITYIQFEETFAQLYKQGYNDVIVVTISSTGSNTYNNALLARDNFYGSKDTKAKMKIHIIDSKTYSMAYGLPVITAAKKAKTGVSAESIVAYLKDWFKHVEIYLAPLTLKFAKKSGRITAAAAFMGELMGLRPVILMADGNTKILEKVRSDKNVSPKILELAVKRMIPKTPYAIVVNDTSQELLDNHIKNTVKAVGYEPEYIAEMGAAVSANAGPESLTLIIKANKEQ